MFFSERRGEWARNSRSYDPFPIPSDHVRSSRHRGVFGLRLRLFGTVFFRNSAEHRERRCVRIFHVAQPRVRSRLALVIFGRRRFVKGVRVRFVSVLGSAFVDVVFPSRNENHPQ